jgi:alkylation response protein AidB-like acyl-CoA dehydrogenase
MDEQTRQDLADMRAAVDEMRSAVLHTVEAIEIMTRRPAAELYRVRCACINVYDILNRITPPDPSPTGE